ncbi:NAD(P)-binding protein [Wolfiporia cocos MD-104 SS10]|uniref:NAD(P)-binding protein n=1 Tax=Wolfiporia cocos (strain MD-104) TaxID=742152 RepID=A0A2H3JIG5_WOLCO|nr:NAD(P)-binding protein [Wolfiporia cocos MD-104 SS10]
MPGRLQHKVALITGAGSGTGLESSLLFAQEGANIALVDVNAQAVERTHKLIAERYPNVKSIPITADVSKEQNVKDMVQKTVDAFGRLDVMFNNAGIMHPEDDNALNTEERIWDLTMNINVKGVWWGCKYAILAMRQNPTDESKGLHTGGSIIDTASFVAFMGTATPQLACATSATLSATSIIFPWLILATICITYCKHPASGPGSGRSLASRVQQHQELAWNDWIV